MTTPIAAIVFRDFETDGVPDSGAHKPRKVDIRQWGASLEAIIASGVLSDAVWKATKALLTADLAHAADTLGVVYADSTAANNGLYIKSGASGSGSWTQLTTFLPGYQFVTASNNGSTANALTMDTSPQLPAGDGVALVALPIPVTNTSTTVTVSFDGGSALTIKTSAGNDPAVGGLVAGMMVAGFVSGSGTVFRLLSDQASAAVLAACEAAQAAAEAARDEAVAAVSGVTPTLATVAAAASYHPVSAPTFLRVAFYDTAQQAGSGALYKSNGTTSGDLTITLDDGTTVAGYDLAEPVLRPEMFGRIGVNAAGDTAAWAALVAKANARGGTVRFEASGEYLISGSTLNFGNTVDVLVGRLFGATFRQQVALSQTFQCTGVGEVDIQGGHFYGYADVQIAASQTPNEIDYNSSSYSGVAAIYCWECHSVKLWHIEGTNHSGGCLVALGTRDRVSMCHNTIQGIGSAYIDPVRDGNQGNGVDFCMMAYPSGIYSNDRGWVVDYEYIGNRTWDSAFGMMAVESRSLILRDNNCGPHPGQHCAYCIECDGLEVTGNIFRDARQMGIKNQLENYAGQFIGPAWASGTAYAVGDKARYSLTLYECTTAHTSGATFTGVEWKIAPESYRNGGIIADNVVMRCGQGLGIISTSGTGTDGRQMWVDGLVVTGNKVLDCTDTGLYMDRLKNATITGNLIQNPTNYGMFIRYFGGTIADNDVKACGLNGLYTSIAWSSFIEGNRFVDCGLAGSADDTRAVVDNLAQSANGIPFPETSPKVFFEDNKITFTSGDAAGNSLVYSTDTALHWQIVGTAGTTTTKNCKIDGTIDYQHRNHFAGYANTAQNIPAYTITYSADRVITTSGVTAGEVGNVLCTLISDLQARKIVA